MAAVGAPAGESPGAIRDRARLASGIDLASGLMGPLRILFYVKGFPPRETGGPAEVAYRLAREWLRDPLVRLTLVVQTDSEEEEIRRSLGAQERLTVLRLPYYPSARDPITLGPVVAALRSADVVHFNEFPFRHLPLILFAKVCGIPIVFSLHGLLSQEARTFLGPSYPLVVDGKPDSIRLRIPSGAVRLLLAAYRWLSGAWRAVATPSEALKRDATALESVDAARVVVIPHGVEMPSPSPSPAASHEGFTRILFVGKLEEIKGPDLLFAALERLRAEGILVDASIVGTGSLEEYLRSWAARLDPHRI